MEQEAPRERRVPHEIVPGGDLVVVLSLVQDDVRPLCPLLQWYVEVEHGHVQIEDKDAQLRRQPFQHMRHDAMLPEKEVFEFNLSVPLSIRSLTTRRSPVAHA